MIPLISSLCYGPLGYRQIPRTWWKTLLKAFGKLDKDYPPCTHMLDHWWLEGMGIPDDQMIEYVSAEKPSYLAFENWITKAARRKPNPVGRNAWNTLIETRIHRPSKFYSITSDLSLEPAADLKSAVVLNHLEDWYYFYLRDFPNVQTQTDPVVPLISTLDYGRLGVCQLPRTWHKVTLEAVGKLHPDYPGCGDGLDAKVLKVLNLDREKTVDYLKTKLPSYLEFEDWIRKTTNHVINQDDVRDWNDGLQNRVHVDEKRKSILKFMKLPDDGSITSAVVLNHIEDWEYAFHALRQGGE